MEAFSSLLTDSMNSIGSRPPLAAGSSWVPSCTKPISSDLSHWLPTSSNDAIRSVAGRSWPVVQRRTASTREKSSSSMPPISVLFWVRTGIRSRYHV